MPTKKKPDKVTVRSYNVGFGDCFLLIFRYDQREKYILLDFGSTKRPPGSSKTLMTKIAKDIEGRCGSKLDVVIATHRHSDHISGFRTYASGKGCGDIIAGCKPDLVLQPWTEHPLAEKDATEPPTLTHKTDAGSAMGFSGKMNAMQSYIDQVLKLSKKVKQQLRSAENRSYISSALKFWDGVEAVGASSITNKKSVKNLLTMGKKNYYLSYGSSSGLSRKLPGVKVHVLGPPTLKQSQGATLKQKGKDAEEFWKLQARAAKAITVGNGRLFPKAKTVAEKEDPVDIRWFKARFNRSYGDQVLRFVRSVDKAMNNTSLILLFEFGEEKLLFSGDAQIENWEYALKQPETVKLLEGVTFYKVGHHGSKNATPKTLWKLFENKKSISGESDSLTTANSTLAEHHHDVPIWSLVKAMEKESAYHTTQSLGSDQLFMEFEFNG